MTFQHSIRLGLLALSCLSLSFCKTSGVSSGSADVKSTPGGFLQLQDGCYGMSVPGASSGVICVQGLGEEGIGGAGVRVAYGTQTSNTQWCAKTTSSGFKNGKYFLAFNPSTGMETMTFSGTPKSGDIEVKEKGEAANTMSYSYVSTLKSADMMKSAVCRAAGIN